LTFNRLGVVVQYGLHQVILDKNYFNQKQILTNRPTKRAVHSQWCKRQRCL